MARRLLSLSLITLLVCTWQPGASAAPVPVRYINGTIHGFLELRSQDGHVIASGDLVQVANGRQVTARLLFTFKDGSIDDETTVFTQRRNFQLITDHHIQKGPFFPHPIDLMIDARSGQVTVRSTGKDGKEEVKTDHIQLPPDLANGMVPTLIQNIRPDTPETRVSILAATPKLRLVTLFISPRGEETFSLAGASRKAMHYEIRIDLGGVSGMVAPMVGKQPPNIQLWIIGGPAPSFLREEGPIYPEGPVFTIELASPTWPESQQTGN
ncbi:MAG TPA: hypothetical protein VH308_11620 [Terracidiphilus sp.]|nr:hypothetical protein [Terracidiphilus sp.]